jgi:hypothetical protein
MLPDPQPVDDTPTTGPSAPATDPPSGRVWWAIVGVVALLVVIGGVTALALQPPGPASVEKLAELLVDPAGRTTHLQLSIDPETGERLVVSGNGTGPGERWTVTRDWTGPGTNRGGWLNLTQYETEDQARTGFTRAVEAMRLVSLTPQVVPSHPDAYFEVGEIPREGSIVQIVTGAGVKGTIVVWGLSNTDTVDWLRRIITDQLGRLP